LIHVKLEVAEQDDVLRVCVGEHAVEQLEGVQWIGAGGDAVVLHVNEPLGGGPGVEATFEGGADGSDLCFRTSLLGGDDRESGVSGAEIGL
jgi:hypothetical protein